MKLLPRIEAGYNIGMAEFEEMALLQFRHQYRHNIVYREYVDALGVDHLTVDSAERIPFLPVTLFKSREITTGTFTPAKVFLSSGTTAGLRSRHLVKDIGLYRRSFTEGFRIFYGDPGDVSIYALLPSYIELGDSSLLFMVDSLVKENRAGEGGFFAGDHQGLVRRIRGSLSAGRRVLLLGVSYALLDLAEELSPDLGGVIVMETGGMKGRREELVRAELHDILKSAFRVDSIHSEYGMTELLSQAWSSGEGRFYTPPWMRIVIRDPLDPFSTLPAGRRGAVNVIDLANLHSCSFIETSDLGVVHTDGSFEISGRFDNSDIRGCNLLMA